MREPLRLQVSGGNSGGAQCGDYKNKVKWSNKLRHYTAYYIHVIQKLKHCRVHDLLVPTIFVFMPFLLALPSSL